MTLHSPIARFSTGTYDVTRRGETTYPNGIATVAASSSFEIDASIQPLSGRELQQLPEAESGREIRLVLTTTPVAVRDRVEIDDETWEIVRVETWRARSLTHYRAYAGRIVEGE